ncbi:hypothetical protein BH11MYX4_BH11MYX4_37850 [soil metagenome]
MRRRLLLLLVVLLEVGCSLLTDLSGYSGAHEDGGGGADSAGRDAPGADEDAPRGDAGRCDPTKPFGAPLPLAALNLPCDSDRAARLTPDERTVYFSSDRSNARRIYRSTRAGAAEPFGPPVLLDELATPSTAYIAAAPSADGLELIVEERDTAADTAGDLRRYTRAAATGRFGNATEIGSVKTNLDETDPNLGAGGLELWFARPAGARYDIFVASRTSLAAPFGPPSALVGDVSRSSAEDTDPVPSADGTELFFQSDRDGPARVFVAHRSSAAEPFGAPVHVAELDGSGTNDVPNWLSTDRCVLYLTSTPASGPSDLYVATRPR